MSYQSAQDPRLHFGLGQNPNVDAVEIRWPSGVVTKLSNLKGDQIIAIKEGAGIVEHPFPRVPPRWAMPVRDLTQSDLTARIETKCSVNA